MYFLLGFSIAGLMSLMFLPMLCGRARRLTLQQLQTQLPLSMEEVHAERSLLRAEWALRERWLEQKLDAQTAAKAQVMADVARRVALISDLDAQLKNSETRAASLETKLSETEKIVEETTSLLNSTKSELDALRELKSAQDEVLEKTSARLRVFETRHQEEADLDKVVQAAFARPVVALSPRLEPAAMTADGAFAAKPKASVAPLCFGWSEWLEQAALEAMPPREAIAHVQRRAGREDEGGARGLIGALGRLPLTLDLAATYCKHTQTSFEAYTTMACTLVAVTPSRHNLPCSLAAAFDLAAAEAIRAAPAAETLLAIVANCAPERIPQSFIEGVTADDGVDAADAMRQLVEMSLVKRARFEDGTSAVSIHALLQQAARERAHRAVDAETIFERMIRRLTQLYPADGYSNQNSWPLCAQLTPHLIAVCKSSAAHDNWGLERADLLVRAGCYFQGRAAYARAEALFRNALSIREKLFGSQHPETAASLNNLAALLCAQGDAIGAQPLLERALKIFEEAFGPDYPYTGRYLASYARLLVMIDRPGQALALVEPALTRLEQSLGVDHVLTQDSARVAAEALDALGRYEEARDVRARRSGAQRSEPADERPAHALRRRSLAELFGFGSFRSRRLAGRAS